MLDRHERNDGSTDIRVRLAEKALSRFLAAFPEATSEGPLPKVA